MGRETLGNIYCGFTLQSFFVCHPELVEGRTNKKRIFTSIRQPFGRESFFNFYCGVDGSGKLYDFPILEDISESCETRTEAEELNKGLITSGNRDIYFILRSL